MFHTKDKILDISRLLAKLKGWRVLEHQIVFTNGCFDLIHVGHVRYLEEASQHGDRLIVGLNTDESVKKLKGPSRPILSELDRAEVLAAFEFVDAVILFEEDTPYQLIQAIEPDILVKGGDYQPEEIVGYNIVSERGGKVLSLQLVEGKSTSSLIERIQQIS